MAEHFGAKWMVASDETESTPHVMHRLCIGVITDTLVITELRGVRVVQIP